jgi:hypothetical protein
VYSAGAPSASWHEPGSAGGLATAAVASDPAGRQAGAGIHGFERGVAARPPRPRTRSRALANAAEGGRSPRSPEDGARGGAFTAPERPFTRAPFTRRRRVEGRKPCGGRFDSQNSRLQQQHSTVEPAGILVRVHRDQAALQQPQPADSHSRCLLLPRCCCCPAAAAAAAAAAACCCCC